MIKDNIKGKIGTFNFIDGRLIQKLNMYKFQIKNLCFNFQFFSNTSMVYLHFLDIFICPKGPYICLE